jgi:hypothetical protein
MSLKDSDIYREAVQDLEKWLRAYAKAGIPELVLIQLLRDQARNVEREGYVSRIERPSVGNPPFESRTR